MPLVCVCQMVSCRRLGYSSVYSTTTPLYRSLFCVYSKLKRFEQKNQRTRKANSKYRTASIFSYQVRTRTWYILFCSGVSLAFQSCFTHHVPAVPPSAFYVLWTTAMPLPRSYILHQYSYSCHALLALIQYSSY